MARYSSLPTSYTPTMFGESSPALPVTNNASWWPSGTRPVETDFIEATGIKE
ncbi:hypothetical protein DPMN_129848 [Dreissena polymorpha]|uniref:Uncharacterized protein n=1 Tax=Dreissena polymorpha TaxID=45954 RepID=A0A9D4K0X3_DREPO|nr:hypothetical protein DPMN_129848 [Dreissena polymorpha]